MAQKEAITNRRVKVSSGFSGGGSLRWIETAEAGVSELLTSSFSSASDSPRLDGEAMIRLTEVFRHKYLLKPPLTTLA